MDTRAKGRYSAADLTPTRNSPSSSAWTGLRERVRSSWAGTGTRNSGGAAGAGNAPSSASTAKGAGSRNRQLWVVKATESDRDSMKPEDWRRIVAEIWEANESGWVLQRVRERPITSDHVVAFKVLTLMHRVLQQGPPEVASEWGLPNGLLDELVTCWSASRESRALQGTQQLHCTQAVVEYARLLSAKMELMVERDADQGRFDGNMVYDRLLVESSDLLQALAVLLNFAEKVMPLALHLVAPSKDWRRLERSHYMRLYVGAVLALINEAWTLLCTVSLFVKHLLCQVHTQKQQQSSLRKGRSDAERPAWLQLSLHLLAAKPRFTWFHASMCDLVAHCHQLRCAGYAELAPCIPAVPQSLLNLFADLGELVRGQQGAEKDGRVRESSLSDISTTAGSTPLPGEDGSPQGTSGTGGQGSSVSGNWEPSPCVLDALKTVDSLQRQPLAGSEEFGSASGSSSGHLESPRNSKTRGQQRLNWGDASAELRGSNASSEQRESRGGSAPVPHGRQRGEANAAMSGPKSLSRKQPPGQGRRNSHRSTESNDPGGRGYMMLDEESEPSTSVPASASGETEHSGEMSNRRSISPPHSASAEAWQEPFAADESAPLVSQATSVPAMAWPAQEWPPDPRMPFLNHSAPPSWAKAICHNNAARAESRGTQSLFRAPLWQSDGQASSPNAKAGSPVNSTEDELPTQSIPRLPFSHSDQQRPTQRAAGGVTSETSAEAVMASPSRAGKITEQITAGSPANKSALSGSTSPFQAKEARPRSLSPRAVSNAEHPQAPERLLPSRPEHLQGERPQRPPLQHPGIPLNPFDLSASQLQRAVQGMDPHSEAQATTTDVKPPRKQQSSYIPPPVSRQPSATQSQSQNVSPQRRYTLGPGFGGAFAQDRPTAAGPPLHVQLPGMKARAAAPPPVAGTGGAASPVERGSIQDERNGVGTPRKGTTPRNRSDAKAEAASPAGLRDQQALAAKPSGARAQGQAEAHRGPKARSPVHAQNAAAGAALAPAPPAPLPAPAAAAQPAAVSRQDSAGSTGSAEWEVDPAELRLEEMVGSGTTAEVFRGSWHGTDVAVKKLRHSGPLSVEFTRELSVLLRLRHPNLVLFMGASMQAQPMIISEFCAGGTVFMLLHQRPALPLAWRQRLKVAIDVAKGMNFLHRRQVVHRDLKSLNLLLVGQLHSMGEVPAVKISDFGLSRMAQPEQQKVQACMTSGAGTYHWMAPEVLDGHIYDEKVDVYSYGICLFELIARRIPYDGSGLEPVSIAVAVSKGRRPDLRCVPQDCPADLRFTMECCWAHCPTGRPGFDTILETLKLVHCP